MNIENKKSKNPRLNTLTSSLFLIGAVASSSVWAESKNLSEEFLSKVKMRGWISQGMQAIEADSGAFDEDDTDMSPGFNRFRYALGFDIQLEENIDAYVEFSEEPNDFGVDYTPHVDFAVVNFALDKHYTVQIGTIGTGMFNYRGFSDGADVQSNPLIGNTPADMAGAAEGIKLLGSHDRLQWEVAISSSDFGESFGGDRGLTYIGKAAYEVSKSVGLGFALSSSHHGDQVREGDSVDDIVRAGFYGGDGDNYRFPSSDRGAIRNTHMGLIPGLDTTGLHIDMEYQESDVTVRAWAGWLKDDFSFVDADGQQTVASQYVGFGEIESEVSFYGLEGIYDVNDKWYVAARYTLVENQSDGVNSEANLSRFQVGGGYRYSDNTMFKAELVQQVEEENSAGQIGSDWGGAMLEASFTF